MKLIEFAEQNMIIAKDQPEYLPMPAYVDRQTTTCCWQLSWRERLIVLFRGRLWHTILNFSQPLQPQRVQVEFPFVNTRHKTHDH